MIYFILAIYVVLMGYWIKSSSLFAIDGLSRPFIFLIFISKIIIGLLYRVIHELYFYNGDTFSYLNESTLIGSTFCSFPSYYIGSLLGFNVATPLETVFVYPESVIFWKDLGTYALVHFHALLYPLTFGDYNLHVFFIAVIGLFASLNFYKIFGNILHIPKKVLIICCFFMPSLTFWTSGLHKDIYIFFGLSLFILSLLEFQEQFTTKTLFKLLSAIFIIGLARHYLLALLLPPTIAYWITLKNSKRIWLNYSVVYLFAIIITIFAGRYLFHIEVFEVLANKQSAFLSESGGSAIPDVQPFSPTIFGVIEMAPIAIVNVFTRPFLWECQDFLQILASFEILCFLFLILFVLFAHREPNKNINPLVHFIIAYCISNLLLVGLLVSNIGTIVRYRAIALGLLSALLTQIIDFYSISFQKNKIIAPSKKPNTAKKSPIISNEKSKIPL